MLTDYYFWFAQPSSILNQYDWAFSYLFLGMLVASFLFWLVKVFLINHPVVKNLTSRFVNMLLWTGILGAVWFAFRYQNIPIFGKRAAAGAVMLVFIVWLAFILKFVFTKFSSEKREYDFNVVKSKYIK